MDRPAFAPTHASLRAVFGVAFISWFCWLGWTETVAQETGTVRGVVHELETGRPIAGVAVAVVGTAVQVTTDADGFFRLTELPPGDVLLRFTHEGHVTVVEKVRVDSRSVTGKLFELPVLATVLDELNVVGRGGQTGDSRTIIETDDVRIPSPRSLGDIIDQLSGVQLIRATGEVGMAYHLRIRGVNSFSFSATPVVYIDGVRIPGIGEFGSPSALDFINPWEVGRIEVLRGPAATAPYGTGAQNGVILITTKRGQAPRQN